jgi:hypothetical protein
MNITAPKLLRVLLIPLMSLFVVLGAASARSPQTCTFDTPEGWQVKDVRWVGSCTNGRATGLGVLRHLPHGKVEHVFYGRLEKGAPARGAIDMVGNGGGYKAGEFVKGAILEKENDFDARFRGLEEAAKSALVVAKRFEKEGNKASAKYYREKSKMWEQQIR